MDILLNPFKNSYQIIINQMVMVIKGVAISCKGIAIIVIIFQKSVNW